MYLEMGTFPVTQVQLRRARTHYHDGHLEVINRRSWKRSTAMHALPVPISKWPVPANQSVSGRYVTSSSRVSKSKGRGGLSGICGALSPYSRWTHASLAGMGIVEVSSELHDAGGDYVEIYIDMSGPGLPCWPQSQLINLCLVVEPDAGLGNEAQAMRHEAALVVNDRVAAATRDLISPHREVFTLGRSIRLFQDHLPVVRAFAPGHVGIPHGVLYRHVWADAAHTTVVSAPE